ncbi:MAG: hypothetical protein ACPGLV_12175 [Bacteroidia bacterium]
MQKTADNFNSMLSKSQLSNSDNKLIDDLIDEFPFFQTARFLKFKNGLSANDFNSDRILGKLALQTYNREFLFDLAKNNPPTKKTEKTVADPEPELIETSGLSIPGFSFQLDGKVEKAKDDDPIIFGENLIEYDSAAAFNIEKEFTLTGFKPTKPNRTSELIDSFLSQQKTEKPKPKVHISQIEDSSLEIPNDLVSETLAKIYLKQEKFNEAINVYEKLMLVEPEKKSIFARSISEIKTKIE